MSAASPHHVVFGNEKGGTGKSTLAMHVVVCLLGRGTRVGVVDVDSRQRTVSRFLDNRRRTCEAQGLELPMPGYRAVARSEAATTAERQTEDTRRLQAALDELAPAADVLVIDCPGSYTHLSRLAHALADTLVTPMNDSFIDLDLLGHVNPETWQVEHLSHYAEMVWESRKFRSAGERPPMDWVVTRNRLATLDSINNRRVDAALDALRQRILFRYVPGLYERVIYKELFPRGLTLLDLDRVPDFGRLQMSHVAARSEVRHLVAALKLPEPAAG